MKMAAARNGEQQIKLTKTGSFVSIGLVCVLGFATWTALRMISSIESRIMANEIQLRGIATSVGRVEGQLSVTNTSLNTELQKLRDRQTEMRLQIERLQGFHPK